jgi:putative transposase
MAPSKYSAEEVIGKLRQVDAMRTLGRSVGEALQSAGLSQTSYYRWRSQYDGLTRTLRGSSRPSTPGAKSKRDLE